MDQNEAKEILNQIKEELQFINTRSKHAHQIENARMQEETQLNQDVVIEQKDTKQPQKKRLDFLIFKEKYQKALERTIDFASEDDAEVMIMAMKKKFKSAKEKNFIQSAISRMGVFAHHPLIFQQESATTQLFREIQYKFVERREIIFNQGDIGDTYYMIMKGEIYCLVPTFKNSDPSEETLKKKQNKKQKTVGIYSEKDGVINEEQLKLLSDEDFLKVKFPQFKQVKIFKGWEGFGDIALITQQYRTATMVCKEDSHLICLTKSGFDKIIGEVSRQQKLTQVKFLKQFPFFSGIPKSKLMSILMEIEIQKFTKNTILFQEGQPITQVYFILSGEVEIYKKHYVEKEDSNIVVQLQRQSKENSMNRALSSRNNISNVRTICLSIIGQNSYCGIDDIMNGKVTRSTSAQCISPSSTIYVLSKEKFLDSLKVYKQFEKNSVSCAEKDNLIVKRAEDIAQYINNSLNNKRQDFDDLSQKESARHNPTEIPIKPLTNPREIIRDRVILAKEITSNKANRTISSSQCQFQQKNTISSQEPYFLKQQQSCLHYQDSPKSQEKIFQFIETSNNNFAPTIKISQFNFGPNIEIEDSILLNPSQYPNDLDSSFSSKSAFFTPKKGTIRFQKSSSHVEDLVSINLDSKNKQNDIKVKSKNIYSEALEKRVDLCELENFEKMREFSHLKSNNILKQIISQKHEQKIPPSLISPTNFSPKITGMSGFQPSQENCQTRIRYLNEMMNQSQSLKRTLNNESSTIHLQEVGTSKQIIPSNCKSKTKTSSNFFQDLYLKKQSIVGQQPSEDYFVKTFNKKRDTSNKTLKLSMMKSGDHFHHSFNYFNNNCQSFKEVSHSNSFQYGNRSKNSSSPSIIELFIDIQASNRSDNNIKKRIFVTEDPQTKLKLKEQFQNHQSNEKDDSNLIQFNQKKIDKLQLTKEFDLAQKQRARLGNCLGDYHKLNKEPKCYLKNLILQSSLSGGGGNFEINSPEILK